MQPKSCFLCLHNSLLSVQVDRSNDPIVVIQETNSLIQNNLKSVSMKIKIWLCSKRKLKSFISLTVLRSVVSGVDNYHDDDPITVKSVTGSSHFRYSGSKKYIQ